MSCKDVHQKFKVSFNPIYSGYDLGLVYCSTCKIYLTKEKCRKEKFCPCCNLQVRKEAKYKTKKKVLQYA